MVQKIPVDSVKARRGLAWKVQQSFFVWGGGGGAFSVEDDRSIWFPPALNIVSKIEYLRCILVSEVVLIKDPPGDISVSTWQAIALGRAFETEGK